MYAIVDIAGQQFKVEEGRRVYVHRLAEEEGKSVKFDAVLLLDDDKTVNVGTPLLKGASIKAKILSHVKGDKVIVFKKKRRKGYKVKNGHRQYLSEIIIESIVAKGAKPAKKETKKETPKKAVTKKTSAKKATAKKATAKGDDLKKIEGIGPKIAEIFNNAGITTFAELAATSVEKLQEILAAAGSRYASKKPGSWPKQAKMAAEGKWDELKAWQDAHNHGIE